MPLSDSQIKEAITHRWDESSSTYDGHAGHGVKNAEEREAWEDVFETPMHPYTRLLLSRDANEDIDETEDKELAACKFFVRCKQRTETCKKNIPGKMETDNMHYINCHNPLPVISNKTSETKRAGNRI